MNTFQIMGSTTANYTLVKVGGQHSQRYFAKPRKQQSFRIDIQSI
jgi:hypothetical protein